MKTYLVQVEVQVADEQRLTEYANEQIAECWGTDLQALTHMDETPIERALLETLFFSNANPSPDEIGINFTGESKVTAVHC